MYYRTNGGLVLVGELLVHILQRRKRLEGQQTKVAKLPTC